VRKRHWLSFSAITVVAVFAAVFYVTSAAAVSGSPSGFESSDGNLVLNTSGNTDWNCFQGSGGFLSASYGSGKTAADCAQTTGATNVTADQTGELEVKSGQKFDTACPVIQVGNNPPKDEWTNVAEYSEFSPNLNAAGGHDFYFYGASIRPVVNGNSSGNIYFNQLSNGCHSPGDILLAFDFLNGGGTPSLHSLTWETSIPAGGTGCFVSQDNIANGCWGNLKTINGANFDGNVNTGTIAAGDNSMSQTSLPANAFAEFGINLTQALGGGPLPCFANQTWESRSSGSSFTSNPEDVEGVNRPTCGTITIIKHTLDGAGNRSGVNQSFSYSSTGGLSPSSFSLNDSAGTDNSSNTRTYQNQAAGDYTVTEGDNPANFTFVSDTCVASGAASTTASSSGKVSTIHLTPGGSVTCTYVNQQQLGAIKISKTSIKGTVLAGAHFSITGPNSYSNSVVSGSDGTVCVDSLPFGTYSVQETAAPAGFSIDDSTAHSVVVNANATCADNPYGGATFSATDTPLTDLTAHVNSEVSGGTQSSITCVNAANHNIGDSPDPSSGVGDPETLTANGLAPGTYTCTVVIDP